MEPRDPCEIPPGVFFGGSGAGGGDLLFVILEVGEGLFGTDPVALLNGETTNDSPGTSDDRSLPVCAKGRRGRIEGGNRLSGDFAGANRNGRFFLFAVSVLAVPVRPVAVGISAASGYENRHENGEERSRTAYKQRSHPGLDHRCSFLCVADWSGSPRMPRRYYVKSVCGVALFPRPPTHSDTR